MTEKKSILYVQTSNEPQRQYSPLVLAQTAKAMDIEAKVYYLGEALRVLRLGEAEKIQLGTFPTNLNQIFPTMINEALKEALIYFDRLIKGFIGKGIMLAPETRTSAPVRILRDPNSFCSVNTKGLYPIGEGSGYAGGIMSSAVDALWFVSKVKPFS